MVSFILTRTFVISAMFVGALPLTNAAPVRIPLTEAALRLPFLQGASTSYFPALADVVAHVAPAKPQSSAYLVLPIPLNSEPEVNRALRAFGLKPRDASPDPEPFDIPAMRKRDLELVAEDAALEARQCMHDGSCMRRREPEPEPIPEAAAVEVRQCMHDGSCMKRGPEPEPVAAPADVEARQCMHDGSCMKREPDSEPVDVPTIVEARQCMHDGSCMKREPDSEPAATIAELETRQCLHDGSCFKREAEPELVADLEARQCMDDGSCLRRRMAAPEPVAEAAAPEARQCMHDGSCM